MASDSGVAPAARPAHHPPAIPRCDRAEWRSQFGVAQCRRSRRGWECERMALGEAVRAESAAATVVVADEQMTLQTRRGRVLLTGFTTAHFSHHISNSLLNPLLPFIRDSFQLSYGQSGWLVSAFAVSLGLSNAPIGY